MQFTKEELNGLLIAIQRANWNGGEVESVSYLKKKIVDELKKLEPQEVEKVEDKK